MTYGSGVLGSPSSQLGGFIPGAPFGPVFIGPIIITNIGPFGIVLNFSTSELSKCTVHYGYSIAYGKVVTEKAASLNHAIALTNNIAGPTIYYNIIPVASVISNNVIDHTNNSIISSSYANLIAVTV